MDWSYGAALAGWLAAQPAQSMHACSSCIRDVMLWLAVLAPKRCTFGLRPCWQGTCVVVPRCGHWSHEAARCVQRLRRGGRQAHAHMPSGRIGPAMHMHACAHEHPLLTCWACSVACAFSMYACADALSQKSMLRPCTHRWTDESACEVTLSVTRALPDGASNMTVSQQAVQLSCGQVYAPTTAEINEVLSEPGMNVSQVRTEKRVAVLHARMHDHEPINQNGSVRVRRRLLPLVLPAISHPIASCTPHLYYRRTCTACKTLAAPPASSRRSRPAAPSSWACTTTATRPA